MTAILKEGKLYISLTNTGKRQKGDFVYIEYLENRGKGPVGYTYNHVDFAEGNYFILRKELRAATKLESKEFEELFLEIQSM